MASVCYFPVVSHHDDLYDLLSRAAWFLSFLPIDRIYVPVASENLQKIEWRVAPGMDRSIANAFDWLLNRIEFIVAQREIDLEPCMRNVDIIFRWKKDSIPEFVSADSLESWQEGKRVWQVDPVSVRMEGSFYIEAGLSLLQNRDALISENHEKFRNLVNMLGKFERAYLMATGPSVSRYDMYDYSNAISIICNSVILDEQLMDRVKPEILVFADPIFHFGPSEYAAEFRQALREVSRRHDFTICIPFKYYSIFTSAVPELKDRTVAIPFSKEIPFNFDLNDQFAVKTTANVLTLLMIPLGATFAKEICLLGCNGRPLEEDSYFWKHNQKTQLNEKMSNIREVHPGFFAIDYNDYYLEHCNMLEAQLREAEKFGNRFTSLGFSYIPALRDRIGMGRRNGQVSHRCAPQRILLVDPDAKNWSGHYMAYNEKLCEQIRQNGVDVGVVCRSDLEPEILASRPHYLPRLTTHSWAVGNRVQNGEYLQNFESEIQRVLEEELSEDDSRVLLYMYCGSLDHAKVLANFYEKYEKLSININLFWLSFTLNPDRAREWKPFFEWLDAQVGNGGFIATLPTVALRNELAELTDCILPVAPHPSTGVSDNEYRKLAKRTRRDCDGGCFNVLFPSSPRPEKGYQLSVECARILGSEEDIVPIIRHAPTFSTSKAFAHPPEGMPPGVEVVEGELSDEEFLGLFERSDIVVLPYTPDAFSKRTSGLLIDAIYHRIPSVVVRGTWLANMVQKYGCGVIVEEASASNFVEAVKEISQHYSKYQSESNVAADDYFYRNSWQRFAHFLLYPVKEEKSLHRTALVGPYNARERAHLDETNAIAKLYATASTDSVMIDVGAHHGSALMPFLNKGWKIFAFEPDENNNARLLEKLARHKNGGLVTLDDRCVSNKSMSRIPFYSSEQSTGISSLSAFHESHVQAQLVDATTLAEYFEKRTLSVVNFLKIDTEGYDLFVLQGFPWERTTPSIIECEFEDKKTVPLGYTFDDLAQFLEDKGYTVYVSEWHPVVRYGTRHNWNRLVRYPCELSDSNAWGNLIAFHDKVDDRDVIAAFRNSLDVDSYSLDELEQSKTKGNKLERPIKSPRHRVRIIHGEEFVHVETNRWRYSCSDAPQQLWQAIADEISPNVGCEFSGWLRVTSNQPMKIVVSLGRHGTTEYEGSHRIVKLVPNEPQNLRLTKEFVNNHTAIRLQLEVKSLEKVDSADLMIEPLLITETIASVRRRLSNADIDLSKANRLFRQGDYLTALGIYLLLHQRQSSLALYGENAMLVAHRLGMNGLASVDDLLWGVA